MTEVIKVQKLEENLIIIIPTKICEKLNIEEGSQIEIEYFMCGGENGARIKLKKWRGIIMDWDLNKRKGSD